MDTVIIIIIILVVVLVLLLGSVALCFLLKPKTKPFHVQYEPFRMVKGGVDLFPLVRSIMGMLSDTKRQNHLTKMVKKRK